MSKFISLTDGEDPSKVVIINLDHVVKIKKMEPSTSFEVTLVNGAELYTKSLYASVEDPECWDNSLTMLHTTKELLNYAQQTSVLPAEPNTKIHWLVVLGKTGKGCEDFYYYSHTVPLLGWEIAANTQIPSPICQKDKWYESAAAGRGLYIANEKSWVVEYPNGYVCDNNGDTWDSISDWFNRTSKAWGSGDTVTDYVDLSGTNSKTAAADAEHIAGAKPNLWSRPKQKSQPTTAPVE